jgi:plasmid stabilization system protein ParE
VAEAIFAAIDDIAQNPLGARPTSDPSVRAKVVSRYGYKIFYCVAADAVEILHVRHGARRPWPAEGSR